MITFVDEFNIVFVLNSTSISIKAFSTFLGKVMTSYLEKNSAL